MKLQKFFLAMFALAALSLIGYTISSHSVNAESAEVNAQKAAKSLSADNEIIDVKKITDKTSSGAVQVDASQQKAENEMRPTPDSLEVFPVLSLGKADAPVYLVEYASLSCGHCAEFHNTILPQLKEEFIDKGQVYIEFRDFPTSKSGLEAAKLVRCMDAKRQYKFMDLLFQTQDMWAFTQDKTPLFQNAKLAGMNEEAIEKCLADSDLEATMIDGVQKAKVNYSVSSTPTVIAFPTNEKLQALNNYKLIRKQILRALETAESKE